MKVNENDFSPEQILNNSSLSSEDIQKYRKQNYNVKRGLFLNLTFAIHEDTFPENEDKADIIENIIRNIIENGGKVIPYSKTSNKCHYAI